MDEPAPSVLDELKGQMIALQERYREESKRLFRQGCQRLFDAYPQLESFAWAQYSSYFNDGDECPFNVRGWADSVWVNGYRYDEIGRVVLKEGAVRAPWGGYGYSQYDWIFDSDLGHLEPIYDEVERLLTNVDDDTFQQSFGNHAKVTVYRDRRVEVESYTDHD